MPTKRQKRAEKKLKNISKQRQKYPDIVHQVIDQSDIILQVLDARFPEDTRNTDIEKNIKKKDKKLIQVINKSDLIQNKPSIEQSHVRVSCKLRRGVKTLRNKIKQEAKKLEKDKVIVGVIGYPNTGKSSLINLLIGKASAKIGAEAGFTKGIQKLKLTSNIVLLDSPGVIPKKEYSSSDIEAITKHTKVSGRSYSQVKNPEIIIARLMNKYPNILEKHYKIKANADSELLIEQLGRKKGFLKKQGKVNEDKTSRLILKEWQEGKIKI